MVTFGVAALVLLTAMAAFADRRIVEERLLRAEEADRSKSRFIANMSYELRTPLNSIIGYSELIVESSDEDMTIADAERVHASATHLLALVNDLLDLAKIEANRLILRTAPCDLAQLAAEARMSLEGAALVRRNRIVVLTEGDLPLVHGDALRVKQCLLNVMSNAIKFTEEGEVVVEARRIGQTVVLRVIDTGIGMTPEQMRRLFRPFVQGDASIAQTYGGTGLGLSITKHLMEMMNGAIDVDSAPGARHVHAHISRRGGVGSSTSANRNGCRLKLRGRSLLRQLGQRLPFILFRIELAVIDLVLDALRAAHIGAWIGPRRGRVRNIPSGVFLAPILTRFERRCRFRRR